MKETVSIYAAVILGAGMLALLVSFGAMLFYTRHPSTTLHAVGLGSGVAAVVFAIIGVLFGIVSMGLPS